MFIFILIVIFSIGCQNICHAQKVAVMEARVQVISGSAIQPLQNHVISFDSHQLQYEQLSIGSFLLKTAPSSEIHARVETENEEAHTSKFLDAVNIIDTVTESGEHLLSISGSLKKIGLQVSALQNLLMTVDYF